MHAGGRTPQNRNRSSTGGAVQQVTRRARRHVAGLSLRLLALLRLMSESTGHLASRVPRRWRRAAATTATAILASLLLLATGFRYTYRSLPDAASTPPAAEQTATLEAGAGTSAPGTEHKQTGPERNPGPVLADQKTVEQLRAEHGRLAAALSRRVPRGVYLVIDQTHNRLSLRRGETCILNAICSAGSGMVLQESQKGGRKWVFDTPRGLFHVIAKTHNPVWKKPDWAFLEEGKPIPERASDRFEYGALGEYALYFGDGYMIHGTLYERLLGRSVTHGCIRLGRSDLDVVNRECPVGTPIFIF